MRHIKKESVRTNRKTITDPILGTTLSIYRDRLYYGVTEIS